MRAQAPSFAFGREGFPGSRFRQGRRGSLAFPFFGDGFNLDDLYAGGYPVNSQPPVILLQAARDMAGSANSGGSVVPRESQSSQPLMIELQGGRYVRVNSTAADGEALALNLPSQAEPRSIGRSSSRKATKTPVIAAASLPQNLAPAVLIFRDGRSEEVRDYTIADGVLYARGDFYTDGYWNKKIDLGALNIPETLQANCTRKVNFVLPSSPNEVITRP